MILDASRKISFLFWVKNFVFDLNIVFLRVDLQLSAVQMCKVNLEICDYQELQRN